MLYKEYFTPSSVDEDNYLEHHGVLGMKWGVRRFQNADGTLTEKGKARVSKEYKKAAIKGDKTLSKNYNETIFIKKGECKMENDKIVKLAATIIVGSVLVPIVWNVGVLTVGGIAKIVTKANFNRKMKKGIKEGSIVEIDGQFYEIKVEDAVEEN